MVHDYKAAHTLDRIATLSAFNVTEAKTRRKLNQHSTLYTFDDNSRLQVNCTSGKAQAWHMDWKGTHGDTHLSPYWTSVKVNKQGN